MKALIIACFIVSLLAVYACNNNNVENVLCVEETGYFHKMGATDVCKFIEQAKERGYRLTPRPLSYIERYGYNMCEYCFSPSEVEAYRKKVYEYNERMRRQEAEQARKDSILSSIDDETKQLIIDEWLEQQRDMDEEMNDLYQDEERQGRYY